MKKRTLCILCVLLCGTLLFCGCTTIDTPETSTQGTTQESKLEIYYLASDPVAQAIVSGYRALSTIKLGLTAFADVEEMDLRIAAEIGSGKGPDVVLFTDATTLDTAKMATNNAFLNLSELLTADKTFAEDNYYPVLDAGKVGDAQMLMPLRFSLHYLLTSEEKLQNSGISLPENYTASELMEVLATNAEVCGDDQSAMQTLNGSSIGGLIYDRLRLSNIQVVNMANREVCIMEEVFQEFSEHAKLSYNQFVKSAQILKTYSRDFVGGVSKLTTLMSNETPLFQLRYYNALFDQGLNETMTVLTYPNYDAPQELTADISLYGAILKGTDVQQEAYNFIRYAMDSEVGEYTNDLSINRASVDAQITLFCENPGKRVNIGSMFVDIPKMSGDLREVCESLLNKVASGSIRNSAIDGIFTEAMEDFICGNASYEDCYTKFKNKIGLYVNE